MTRTAGDKLSHEKIQQLLAAVGVRAQEDTSADLDAPEYNWRQCQYFSMDQSAQLTDFSQQVATRGGQAFSRLFNRDVDLTIVSAAQHYASELLDPQSQAVDYAIGINAGGNDSVGMISIPRSAAMVWTAQLLGGEESGADDRELSTLEESLLLDIAGHLTQALAGACDDNLTAAEELACGQCPVEWASDQAIYKISFIATMQDAECGYEASFMIRCDQLETVAGKEAASGKPAFSAAQLEKIILEHIHDVPVSIAAELGTVKVDFGDIMALAVDDILILDKKVTEPIDLRLNGKAFRSGRIAQSEGHYAVAIQ